MLPESPILEIIEAYESETERLARRRGTKAAVASRNAVAIEARKRLEALEAYADAEWLRLFRCNNS